MWKLIVRIPNGSRKITFQDMMLYGISLESFLLVLSINACIGITMSYSTVSSVYTPSGMEGQYSGVNASTAPYEEFYEQVRWLSKLHLHVGVYVATWL